MKYSVHVLYGDVVV